VGPAGQYPPAGRRVLRRISRRGGASLARPEALYGYQAMTVVLAAVRRGGGDRGRVIRAATRAGARASVLGAYAVHARGDVTGRRFARYGVRYAGGPTDVLAP